MDYKYLSGIAWLFEQILLERCQNYVIYGKRVDSGIDLIFSNLLLQYFIKQYINTVLLTQFCGSFQASLCSKVAFFGFSIFCSSLYSNPTVNFV